MRFIDVRVRIPIAKMGHLIEALPTWAQMIGYDKLEHSEPRSYSKRQNGKTKDGVYKPGKGTASEAVLKALTKPMKRFEIVHKLEKAGQKEKAVGSAIVNLADRGLIVRDKEGSYEKA